MTSTMISSKKKHTFEFVFEANQTKIQLWPLIFISCQKKKILEDNEIGINKK